MLDKLTHGAFEPLVGKLFRLHVSAESRVEVELVEAKRLPVHARPGAQLPKREPFSLIFRGPREYMLPQRIYRIEQAELAGVEIFLVPVGPDETGQRYEAIFN